VQRVRQLWNRLRGAGRPESGPPSRLVVGLGNPGSKFAATRHNVGFRIVERLGERSGAAWRGDRGLSARVAHVEIEGEACALVLPETFMNRSGRAVLAACERWPDLDFHTDLLVVYDDMDLETGRIRLRPGGGDGGHRGIGDILLELESKKIPRLRFGVGHPGSSDQVLDWVLRPFSSEEETAILSASLDRAADAIETTIREGIVAAMGQFNAS
jgi:PTH1 family peptidyl-tRNA hydrolase